jgi:hypothetical protein
MNDATPRAPIQDVLRGAQLHPLPDEAIFHSAFVLIRCIDEDGEPGWCFRTTEPLNLTEWLGALTVQVELLKARLVSEWDTDE